MEFAEDLLGVLPYLIRLSDVSERDALGLRKMVAMAIMYQDVGAFDVEAPAFAAAAHARKTFDQSSRDSAAGFFE